MGHADRPMRVHFGHDGWVHGLLFHSNSRYLLSAADDGSFRIWELDRTVHSHFGDRCTLCILVGVGSADLRGSCAEYGWQGWGRRTCQTSQCDRFWVLGLYCKMP
ncbi:hypothetical protein BD414DRAFT_498540 [Trametes punicea]|nr:hypothetical protein BD414DRAFT_498540 [Trametes punicea]